MALIDRLLPTLTGDQKATESETNVSPSQPSNKITGRGSGSHNVQLSDATRVGFNKLVTQDVIPPEITTNPVSINDNLDLNNIVNVDTITNPGGEGIASRENEELLTGEEGPQLTPGAENLRRAVSNFGRSNTFTADVANNPLEARTKLVQGILQNILPAAIQAKSEKTDKQLISAAASKDKKQIVKRDKINPDFSIEEELFLFNPNAKDPGQSLFQLDTGNIGGGTGISQSEANAFADKSTLNNVLLRRFIKNQNGN